MCTRSIRRMTIEESIHAKYSEISDQIYIEKYHELSQLYSADGIKTVVHELTLDRMYPKQQSACVTNQTPLDAHQ